MINLQRYGKGLFLISILILIGLLSFSSIAAARASKQFESLIKERKWDEVFKIATPGDKDVSLWYQATRIRDFLNSRDNYMKHQTKRTYSRTTANWKALVKALKDNKTVRWSKDFVPYLNAQKDTFIAKSNQIREEARIKREKEEQEQIKRQEEARIEQEKEKKEEKRKEEARIKKQEEARIERKKEIEEKKRDEDNAVKLVSNKAAKLGYKKVLEIGVGHFLYNVMQGTNKLEDGLKVLLWSKPGTQNEEGNKKFTISQILEDVLIYNCSEFSNREDKWIEFTIIVPKKQGKLYLEGQVLRGEFFEYTGNITYQTVFGASKTAPVFKIVEMDDVP